MSGKRLGRAKAPGRAPRAAADVISIVIIDDNTLVREGLASLMHEEANFLVVAMAADLASALDALRAAKAQVALVDFSLGDHDSLACVRTISQELPGTKVIVMDVQPVSDDVEEFVRAGASGFILKDASLAQFLKTIRDVAGGAHVLPTELTGSLFSEIASRVTRKYGAQSLAAVRLTERERQVVGLIGEGLSNQEIADRLNVAVHTVKSHVHNVLEKLALHTRLEVAAFTRSEAGR